MKKRLMVILGGLLVLVALGWFGRDWAQKQFFKPTGSKVPSGVMGSKGVAEEVKIIAEDLNVPWGLAFLPDGDILVTERQGTIKRISNGKEYAVQGVRHVGEGGLLGVVLHPDFASNKWLYIYLTTQSGEGLINRVERYVFEKEQLSERTVIIENIPGASNHDGGRLAFGPDKKLYITTGDAGNELAAQDKSSLAGKILRLNDDGSVPNDNPFSNPVYSYGHRNPQGLAWDDTDQLWSSEHGRSGAKSGFDEINLIKIGANYGWPVIEGDQAQPGMEIPAVHSGANDTWAPASLAFVDSSLFFGGLRGESLYEAKIQANNALSLTAHFRGVYGRIRTITISPQNRLFMTTSNTDGRGSKKQGDDKLVSLDLQLFR